ncbi:hypothetical protein P7K49_013156 [Saguinus oedipus]|uniref:Uncharacterized protein n=1 Tax=Saguinus oedipus TaxID=9490 RepID=A0ABQ9VFP3_SAGOE|nr:hypothetical protein P7K49_013156 [Saguinus oedipus]
MQSRASSTADHSQTHTRSLTTRGLRSTTETPHGIRGRRLAPDDTHTPCGGARGSAGDSRSWPTGPLRHKPLVHRAGSDPGRGRRPARTDKIDSPWPTGPPRIREGTSGTTGKHLHGTKPPHTKAILTPFPAWDADWPSAPPRSPLTGPGPPPPWVPKRNRQHPQHQAHMPGISIPSTTRSWLRDQHTPRSGDSRVPTQPKPDGKPHHRRERLARTVWSQQREIVATATGAHSRECTCKQTGAHPRRFLLTTRVGHRRTARVAAPRSRDSQADTREVKNTGPSQRLNREQDRLARSTVDRTPPHASRPDLQRRFARGQRIPDNPVVQNHNSQ